MELTGGGRPGHAGSCSFPPSGAGTNSSTRARRGCASLALPTARGQSLGWAGSRGPGIFRSGRYAGRELDVERLLSPAPLVPGLFLMVMRAGAERPRGCGVLPPPARDRGARGLRPGGERSRSRQSLRLLRWEEQVSALPGGQEGALGWGWDS